MIVYRCDGCGRHLGEASAQKSQEAWAFAQEHNKGELFCAVCRPHAEKYWDEAPSIIQNANEQMQRTIRNHREKFFRERTLKKVEN